MPSFVKIISDACLSVARLSVAKSVVRRVRLACLLASLSIGGLGVLWGLIFAPADYLQGEAVRIIYLHVPSAYLATTLYAAMAISAALFLITRLPIGAIAVEAIAPTGLLFAGLCLATGSLWGQLSWGAWWVWDARLTSVLVLFFLYLGYFALSRSFAERVKARFACSILVLVGAVDLPIVKFSVDWWHSLHQPASLLRSGGSTIHSSILTPLLLCMLAATLFALWSVLSTFDILTMRLRLARLERGGREVR